MRRLSVTLEDPATSQLAGLDVHELRDAVQRAMQVLPVDEGSCLIRLSRSLQELGSEPSVAAVIRQAVDVYLDLLSETRDSIALEAGYRDLALDQERRELVEVMSKRAPARWADER